MMLATVRRAVLLRRARTWVWVARAEAPMRVAMTVNRRSMPMEMPTAAMSLPLNMPTRPSYLRAAQPLPHDHLPAA